MTNEELNNKILQLENQLSELKSYVESKKIQQISFPIDDVSKRIITDGAVLPAGTTTAGATTSIGAFPFNLPANPSGALTVTYKGVTYNLLYK